MEQKEPLTGYTLVNKLKNPWLFNIVLNKVESDDVIFLDGCGVDDI